MRNELTSPRPIPTPLTIRWRDFRARVLPALVFVGGLIVAMMLWQRAVAPPTLLAEVELIRAEVRPVQAGVVAGLDVQLLQPVAAGTVICRVAPVAPTVLDASLRVARAEIELLRANLEPTLAGRRVELDQQRLMLEWMQQRVELASLRAQLAEAEASLARLIPLHERALVSDEVHTSARNLRDGLVAQITEQAQLVEKLQPSIQAMEAGSRKALMASPEETLAAALRVQEENIRLAEAQFGPVELRAPIDGVVAFIHRRNGETAAAGEPIVTVAAAQPGRLIGFLRQPLALEPKVGQAVEIQTRAIPRRIGHARIEQVGQALEPVSPTLLTLLNKPADTMELGLRVHIGIPADLTIHPGEWVDVILRDSES